MYLNYTNSYVNYYFYNKYNLLYLLKITDFHNNYMDK